MPTGLHDGLGNKISSYYDAASDKYVLDVHDADVHHRVVNKLVHQHTATTTTISTASAANDYQINVASTTGFLVGNAIHINTTTIESTHPIITAVTPGTPGVLTLDRRLDYPHLIGDIVTKAIINISSQAGTLASPQEYFAGPEGSEVYHITNLTLSIGHTSAGDMGLFGNLAPLTNGVTLRARINGQYGTLTNWKTNGDINVDTGAVNFYQRSGGGGTHGTGADGAFKARTGAVLRLDGATSDRLEIYVQDDLTALSFFNMKIQGHLEVE